MNHAPAILAQTQLEFTAHDHEFTRSMECCFTARELVIGHTKRRRDDGTDDETAQSVIRPTGRHRASIMTAGAVP